MDKEDVLHIYNGKLLSHKKEWNNAFAATGIAVEIVILSEVSQKEKNKYHILTHIWNLDKWYWWTYLQGRNRETDIVDTEKEGDGKMNWESRTDT